MSIIPYEGENAGEEKIGTNTNGKSFEINYSYYSKN